MAQATFRFFVCLTCVLSSGTRNRRSKASSGPRKGRGEHPANGNLSFCVCRGAVSSNYRNCRSGRRARRNCVARQTRKGQNSSVRHGARRLTWEVLKLSNGAFLTIMVGPYQEMSRD